MKSKNLLFTKLAIIAAVIAMAVFCIGTNIAKKPTITEYDFPFSITYELNGKTEVLEGVYSVSYTGNDGYIKATNRVYEGVINSSRGDADTSCVISENEAGSITLHTKLYADYLMGDPRYDYFSDDTFEPMLVYYDQEYNEYTDEETLLEQGAKIISWEYPEPIENSFRYSHIAHLSSDVVIPLMVIAAAAFLAVLIFVKKEDTPGSQRMNKISVVSNFVIACTVLPFSAIYGVFSDINGSSGELLHQLGYLMPAVMILGITASVGLRRKGFGKRSLAVQFAGPVVFALLIACILITYYV